MSRFRLLPCTGLIMRVMGCAVNHESSRPPNVSGNAVLVRGAKVGWWQSCSIDNAERKVHCTIWNAGGHVLYEDVFVPYDEGPAPTASELQIPTDPKYPGPDRICLHNGRILIPQSEFSRLKRFFDWATGKRAAP